MLEVSIQGLEAIQAKLQAIYDKTGNLRPALLEIGENVVNFNKRRFVTLESPDGIPWAKNSDVTLAHKSGSRPLTDSGELARSIHYDPPTANSVEIGSNADQAAIMG
jgi:phage gpG-like protein